jgi:hypothetical protein
MRSNLVSYVALVIAIASAAICLSTNRARVVAAALSASPNEKTEIVAHDSSRAELDALRARVGDLSTKLQSAASRIDGLEKQRTELQLASAVLRSASPNAPVLLEGSVRIENDALIYSPDAKLQIVGKNIKVSSKTGVMVSDLTQKTIVGNLTLETPDGIMEVKDAVMDVTNGSVTAKKSETQSPETKTKASPAR